MRLKTFFICLIILMIRGWDRLLHAGIWAEDGAIFLSQALTKGWIVMFQPYEGYFHTFNRMAIQIFTFFPMIMIPTLITASTFILYAWVMSMFADQSYRHILKSDGARVMIAAGLCILPGSYEVIGSLCNSHRTLAIYLFFLALRSSQDDLKPQHLLMTFLVAGSAGEVVAFLPLFFYRIYKRFKADPKIRSITYELIIVFTILSWTVASFAARGTNTAPLTTALGGVLRATFAAFTFNFALQPIVGWRMAGNLFGHAPIVFWGLASTFTFFLFRDIWRSRSSDRILVYFGAFCLCAIQELAWIVRPGDILVYKDFFPSMWWGDTRMTYILAFAGFFVWGVLFSTISKKAGIAFVLLYFVLANPLKIRAYGDVAYWKAAAAKLEKSIETGCPKEIHVPTFPGGWEITYTSSKTLEMKDCVNE